VPEDNLLHLVLRQLHGLGVLRTRKMFGGLYIYCNDLFIATVHDGKLYFKANAMTAPKFIALNRPVFSYPKEGGIATLQYYQAPPEVFDNIDAMEHWGRIALLAAQQDSEKSKKKSSRIKSGRYNL
jgi:DNA transformation protein and related proteins